MDVPQTRYAKSSDSAHIAYQVVGEGKLDVVFVPGFVSNLEHHWEDAGFSHLLSRLAAFSRLILFDKRGTGLSDRVPVDHLPSLEQRMDDVRAVMDAAGSRRAALLGGSEGGPMAMLFAATYPARTQALLLYGAYAHFFTWVMPPERLEAFIRIAEDAWGTGATLKNFAPGMVGNERFTRWWARFERMGADPAAAVALARMNSQIDVRHVLPSIRVPTLVLHRRDDPRISFAGGRYLAEHIVGAKFVELSGSDHPIWIGDTDRIVDEIEEFLTGTHTPPPELDRVLTTVLSAALAEGSTGAVKLGDHAWCELLSRHRAAVAEAIQDHRGRTVDGVRADGSVVATFDGPARAVRCAFAIRDLAHGHGVASRAGIHTGEVETTRDGQDRPRVGGFALHLAEQIAGEAKPGEILASATVRDLVAGSGLEFRDCRRKLRVGEAGAPGLSLFAAGPGRRALALTAPAGSALAAPPILATLSARERQVLDLVSSGLSNPAIAAQLKLSEHTVKRHVGNILTKLNMPTRAAAAALAARGASR